MYCDQSYPDNQHHSSDIKYAVHEYDADKGISKPEDPSHGTNIRCQGNAQVYLDQDAV